MLQTDLPLADLFHALRKMNGNREEIRVHMKLQMGDRNKVYLVGIVTGGSSFEIYIRFGEARVFQNREAGHRSNRRRNCHICRHFSSSWSSQLYLSILLAALDSVCALVKNCWGGRSRFVSSCLESGCWASPRKQRLCIVTGISQKCQWRMLNVAHTWI